MASVTEIISKEAIKGLLDLDKSIIKADESYIKFVNDIIKGNEALKGLKATSETVTKAQKQQITNQKKLSETQKENTRLTKQFLSTEAKVARARSDTAKGLEQQKGKLKEVQSEVKLLTVLENKEAGTLDKLKAQVKLNSIERGKLNLATAKGRKRLRELNRETNKANDVIAKNSDALTRQKIGIGKYAQGVKSALLQVAGLGSALFVAIKIFKDAFNAVKNFEKALSSLSAITGATGEDLDFLKRKAIELARESLKSGEDVLKAFELVGSIRPELLKDSSALAEVTKQAIILSEATGGKLGLEEAAKAVTGTLNQFNIASTDAAKATDILVAAQTYGSAAVLQLTETFKTFGTVAADSNLTLIQGAALTEVVADKMIDGSEAGTQLKATLINLKNAGVGYASGQFDVSDALNEVKKQVDSLGSAYEKDQKIIEVFGKRNITVGTILLNNIDKYKELTEKLDENGIAVAKQNTQNDNLAGSIGKVSSAWDAFILSMSGSGGFIKKGMDMVGAAINYWTDLLMTDEEKANKQRLKGLDDFYKKYKEHSVLGQEDIKAEWETALNNQLVGYEGHLDSLSAADRERYDSELKNIQDHLDLINKANKEALDVENAAKEKAKKAKELAAAENARQKELSEKEKKRLIKTSKEIATEQIKIQKEKQQTMGDLLDEFDKEVEGELSKELELYQAQADAIIRTREREVNAEIALMQSRGATEQEINDFIDEKRNEDLNNLMEYLERKLAFLDENSAEYIQLEQALFDARAEMREMDLEDDIRTREEKLAIATQFFQSLGSLVNQFADIQRQALQNEITDLENQKAFELQLVGDNEERKAKINEKYDAKEKELKKKQAEQEKKLAIFNALINTALAITGALAQGGIVGIVMAVLVGALGAYQIAQISKTPIPQFAKGTDSSPAGLALVGEKGRELMIDPSGKIGIADKSTLTNLKRGTKIYSNPETEAILSQSGANIGYDSQELRTTLESNNEKLIKTIKNKRELTIIPSKAKITERQGNYYRTWINSKIRE